MIDENLVWQNSEFSSPKNIKVFESIHMSLFKIAKQNPNSTAIITTKKTYSYNDLINRVAGLSDKINEITSTNQPIALVQKNGINAIAAWFACSLSGKPFLLLEPDHPPVRLFEIIKEANCKIVITDEKIANIFKDFKELKIIVSDGRIGTFQPYQGLNPEEPAMIFSTSGSTGKPKLITYATSTIQVKVQSSIELFKIPQKARVLIAGSHGNYGFLHHALVFLFSGGSISLLDFKTIGLESILNSIEKHKVRHVRFTPSLFRKIAVLPNIKNILFQLEGVRFSGETLLQSDLTIARNVLNPNCLIQNIYGSTESSLFIWSDLNQNENNNSEIVPIGKIYPHSSFAIKTIDNKDYTKGELIIKSKYHALGDLKNGKIDSERFPFFDNNSNERIYETGDIVEQRPNGDLVVLGRLGRMVKIRGNRVFLNEVENHLRKLTYVTGAAILDYDFNGDKLLIGFITVENNCNKSSEDLKNELSLSLPDFMIPSQIKIIPSIPLLQGGKVDYNQLSSSISFANKKEELEILNYDFSKLAQIWDSVLWKGAHQSNSDFVSLGGDSISFMILIAKIEIEFNIKISISELKANSTLPALANMLDIKLPYKYEVSFNNKLILKLFQPSSKNKSKGIALAMPGFRGWTQANTFYKSGILNEYDIWVAEYPVKKDFIIHHNQWWNAIIEIVQNIKDEKIPKPDIIFGFSFSGGMAWIVSQLLSNTPQKPLHVLMVDSPPIHKLKKNHKALQNALKNIDQQQKIPSILINRSPIFNFNRSKNLKNEWDKNDNIQLQLELPTVEHLEMINYKILEVVKPNIKLFLNQGEIILNINLNNTLPDLWGINIYNAFKGNKIAFEKILNEVEKGLEKFSTEHLMHISILLFRFKTIQKAMEIIKYASHKLPTSGTIQFLKLRLYKNQNLFLNQNIPLIFPKNIINAELLLSFKEDCPKTKNHIIKLILFSSDVFLALLISNFNKVFIKIKSFTK